MADTLRILGIDPGLNHTGFGVIDVTGDKMSAVAAGCIHVPAGELCERLAFIHRELAKIIEETRPNLASCEIVFVNVNPKSTLLLGQARGAAIACAAVKGLSVREYTALQIKQSVVGAGHASKEQIQMMVGHILGIRQELQADAADALACAVTCAHSLKLETIHKQASVLTRTGTRSMRSHTSRRQAWEKLIEQRN